LREEKERGEERGKKKKEGREKEGGGETFINFYLAKLAEPEKSTIC